MKWWDKFKGWFRKEADYLIGKELTTIFDHEKINVDRTEYDRINNSMNIYAGKYDKVEYLNSNRVLKKRDYFDLNMMKEVSRTLADLMVNEDSEIGLDDKVADEFIQEVFKETKFIRNLKRYLEPALSLGGLSVKPYYDAGTGKIDFSWALADTFVPLRSNSNGISECVIPSKSSRMEGDKEVYYTLLEFHEWQEDGKYTITNELYKSEDNAKVGKPVRLSELFEDLEEQTIYYFLSRPNFTYLTPSGFNNISPGSPLGLGVCDNAKNTLMQINNVYDQFYWEIKQGKRRLLVSDHLTKTDFDSRGNPRQRFDDETDVFVPIRGDIDKVTLNDMTVDIRSEQYIQSINKFFATLEMQTGLSSGTFTFDGESVKTATEVVSRDSTTYRTRNAHLANVELFIKELIISTLELAFETFGLDGKPLYAGDIPSEEEISVSFDDGVFEDRTSELQYWGEASHIYGLVSKQTAIEKVLRLTEKEAAEELARINKERTLFDPFENEKRAESSLLGFDELGD